MCKCVFFKGIARVLLSVCALLLVVVQASAWAQSQPNTQAAKLKQAVEQTQASGVDVSQFKLTPKPDKQISEDRPVIKVRYPKNVAMQYSVVRLWVNQREVSSNCLRTPRYVSYQPFVDMSGGRIEVRFEGNALGSKEPVKISWGFDLQPPELLSTASHNATRELCSGDVLKVSATGASGCRATFAIDGIADAVEMHEVSPGNYEGVYEVRPSDNRFKTFVSVNLQSNTKKSSKKIEKHITLIGRSFPIVIESPLNHGTVPLEFTIKGHTLPNAKIYMRPNVGMGSNVTTENDRYKGSVLPVTAYADANGNFAMYYNFPIMLPNMSALLNFTAVDEASGREAIPAQIWVNFK